MSYEDDDRKNFRRKKIKNHKKEENKRQFYIDDDFSHSKIKKQFKQKKLHLEEQDILDELDDYT